MSAADFHKKPFDEGTLTKLQIFELYAREWLPVFLSPERPPRPEIHIFDFFAGPGTDAAGEFGSPLRLLRQFQEYQSMAGWPHVRVHAHFSDASPSKIKQLQVAWKKDEINGEADFDINRDNIAPGERLLALDVFRPSKITAFERDLEQLLRDGRLKTELDVVRICFNHGVKRQHAETVLAKLKREGVIEADFRVPQIGRANLLRPIRMLR